MNGKLIENSVTLQDICAQEHTLEQLFSKLKHDLNLLYAMVRESRADDALWLPNNSTADSIPVGASKEDTEA